MNQRSFSRQLILLLVVVVFFSSCGLIKQRSWKLERNAHHSLISADYDRAKMAKTGCETASLEEDAIVASNIQIIEAVDESQSPLIQKKNCAEKYNLVPPVHDLTNKLIYPKKQRTEIEKIQRSFRRQSTWFFVFSLIFTMITAGLIDIDGIAAAFPFLLLTLSGLTAFILILRFMVKAKRLKNIKESLDEKDAQTLEQLRRMKKIGFWGVMSGLGISILSVIILIIII